ncbi:MAG: hypothetical protein ACOC1F_06235 [Myxococcota bacterium]
MRRILATVVCVTVLGGFGCATYRDDLNRAERHYRANEHERALALFRALEPDVDSLSHADRTRYAYLRGINDYRMSGKTDSGALTDVDKAYRAHARHWLALARSLERMKPGGLQEEWKSKLDEALRDLNQDVYGVGVFPEEPVEPGAEPSAPAAAPEETEEPAEGETDEGASEQDAPGL